MNIKVAAFTISEKSINIQHVSAHDNLMLVVHGKCSKTSNTFHSLFSTKMLDIRAGIHKLFVRNANREYHDQTASKAV